MNYSMIGVGEREAGEPRNLWPAGDAILLGLRGVRAMIPRALDNFDSLGSL